jgi:hypothetical protein
MFISYKYVLKYEYIYKQSGTNYMFLVLLVLSREQQSH